jgi:hypothetical protein
MGDRSSEFVGSDARLLLRQLADRTTVRAVLFVAVLAVVTDWPLQITTHFWSAHPMVAGICSNGVMLLLGLTVVQEYLRERELRSWQRVEQLARKNLAYAAGALGKGVAELAGVSIDDDAERFLGHDRVARVRTSAPRAPERGSIPERVAEVLAFDASVETVISDLEALKQAHREFLAQWAPVMVSVGRHAELLERHAALNEGLNWLQRPMRQGRRKHFDDWRVEAALRFNKVVTDAAELHEFTLRGADARNAAWISVLRKHLTKESQERLLDLDRQGSHAIARDFEYPWP